MPGLSFLTPWFLAGAAAIGLPVLLHLFARQTAREQPFAATRFIPTAQVQQSRRRTLTDVLLLVLRGLAILLLAVAFARPYFTEGHAGADVPVTVVAVDTSYSMAAEETWRAALARASDAVDSAPPGGSVAVVAFDDVGRLVFPVSLDRGAARRAIGLLRPGAGTTVFPAAVPAALDALAGRPGHMVVVTDGQRSGLTGVFRVPETLDVEFAVVKPARDNLAVTAIERDGDRVLVTLGNGGLSDRDTEVSLLVDGQVVARQPVAVPAGQLATRVFDGMNRPRGVAVARLVDIGGLPADDERTLVLDQRAGVRVLVVASGPSGGSAGYYLRQALAATSVSRPVSVALLTLPAAQLPATSEAERPDVIVLLATRGLGREAREELAASVDAGSGLLIAVGPDVEAGALGELLRGLPLRVEQLPGGAAPMSLVPVDVRHPVFAAYTERTSAFSRVRVERAVRIGGDPGRVLARLDNGLPGIVEHAVGKGRVLVFASDLDARWNRWPMSATFVPFVREAMDYLSRRRSEPQEYLVGQAPAGLDPLPGAHVLADGRRVAVNVDPRESSLDLAERDELSGSVTVEAGTTARAAARPGAVRESGQALWRYLLFGMIALLISESLVSARRAVRES